MTIRINEEYFQRLLSAPDPVDAVSTLSGFWLNRLDDAAPNFGLSPAEWRTQLVLIYTGEVANGGHIQYFMNRGKTYIVETLLALTEVSLDPLAEVLESASAIFGDHSHKLDTSLSSDQVVQLQSCDARFDKTVRDVDRALQSYLRAHAGQVLLPERGLIDIRLEN